MKTSTDETIPTNTEMVETISKSDRVINSYELFDHHNEVIINHQGEHYRLRITSNQKLILTK